ncbi:uncharacterized protein PITG_20834 [Phytophthora infestans T30-4]|uniref:Uncharacterized protein n=1 Tax=Phytophthora infestans (strain T30-4) TaxID=403677 RepID=D0P2K7_PHYIT|nr:uncharacterized protein PITG_20834 [Phytophthora infestans T30-4]EEY56303.1 conserved hypothetical protein [Phytophthora infestans T30-4]|eukprot:XP_002895468.1 conserved hypothetical protein [Phytophthora infestans T30-4]
MSAPSLPLRVSTCSYFRLECGHEQLFHSEYKRSNRTRGLKILRCFPHCCPEHIDRSYCGSSLSVKIRLAERPVGSAPFQPPPSELLAVFARFEVVNDGVQTETNLDGQWIAGVLDRPSGLVVTIRGSDTALDEEKPVVFHLNSKAFPRWYYYCKSGANKAQRLIKHSLKTYVMECIAVDMDDNLTTISSREAYTQLYRVLHAVSSPEDDQGMIHPLQDKLIWEHVNAPAVAVSKNMALLLAFVRWTPVRLYASQVDEVTLLRVASQTVLWLLSHETLGWFREFFRLNAALILDKKAIRSCFIQFLLELEDHLNAEVFAAFTLHSLANVAEQVIAAVYSHECFHSRRPLVRQILSGQSFAGWNMFVAQLRDIYIDTTSSPQSLDRKATFKMAFPSHNPVERNWNGEWLLDTDDVQWDINEASSSLGRSLRVRTPQSVAGCLDCMHLVLDGKERVFRMLPNGMSTCAEMGSHGDYFGEMRVEAPGQLILFLEMFNWSLEEGSPSYHVRSCIELQRNGQLSVRGDILVTTGSSTFTAEEIPYVGEMSLRVKRKSVEKASARRVHAAGALRDAPIIPWREYGRFRLWYHKL